MYFDPKITPLVVNSQQKTVWADRNVQAHWNELTAQRLQFNVQQELMVNAYRQTMTAEQLACNAVAGLGRDFWADVDNYIIRSRDTVKGMEIVNDLMQVQTTLPIGKTAKLYNVDGDIADDVSISMDGQAPFSFDHTDYDSDGDPIPVFSAGFGVNWRHAAGLQTVGVDLVLDSQEAKLKKFNTKLVQYVLHGSGAIQVGAYPGEGLFNHRNTKKINLGAAGANIDLTTATPAQIIAFFGTGAFGQTAEANEVDAYDVLWVSPQIMANLMQPYFVNGVISGNVMNAIMPFVPVKEFRKSFALSSNEFLGYVRRRDVVSPLVGMTTGINALPRPLPNVNYNFQILNATGISVKKDGANRGGVVYGANLS